MRKLAKLIREVRCSQIVDYVTYPRRGFKSHRRGRCGRWTLRTCGLCSIHHDRVAAHGCSVAWTSEVYAVGRRDLEPRRGRQ